MVLVNLVKNVSYDAQETCTKLCPHIVKLEIAKNGVCVCVCVCVCVYVCVCKREGRGGRIEGAEWGAGITIFL